MAGQAVEVTHKGFGRNGVRCELGAVVGIPILNREDREALELD